MTDSFPRNVLLVGSNAIGSLENAYLRALRRVEGRHVEIFDVSAGRLSIGGASLFARGLNTYMLSGLAMKLVGRNFLRFISEGDRDYDVVIIFKGADFSRRTLEKGRKILPKAVWANFNPDDPLNITSKGSTNRNIIESLGFFDLYCIWNRNLVETLITKGCRRTAYLPFGFDRDFHRPAATNLKRDIISFVGTWDREREAVLSGISEYDLRIYGNGWDRVSSVSPLKAKIVPRAIHQEELVDVAARSIVVLNWLRPQNRGSHNMRTFEIPAMGGLMLTTRTAEQQTFFPEGEACLMYSGRDELRSKIDWVIRSRDAAEKIRRRGIEVVGGHSYDDRAKQLLGILSSAA